jgi:hypothetical protein
MSDQWCDCVVIARGFKHSLHGFLKMETVSETSGTSNILTMLVADFMTRSFTSELHNSTFSFVSVTTKFTASFTFYKEEL